MCTGKILPKEGKSYSEVEANWTSATAGPKGTARFLISLHFDSSSKDRLSQKVRLKITQPSRHAGSSSEAAGITIKTPTYPIDFSFRYW